MNPQPSHFNLDEYIQHHIQDSHEWHLPFLPPILLPEFLSLHGTMVILCAIFLVFLFCVVYQRDQKIPRGITNLLEIFILFIRDQIVAPNFGPREGLTMTPLCCTFFFFILGLNLMGMIPVFSTATANINVTGALAVVTFVFMILGAIYKNGLWGFLKVLVPSGVPLPVLILLFPIEVLGLFIKAFALMIRLFANMLAGHIVVLSLLGLVVLLGFVALPAILMAVFISLLELLVAFLQAYIFTMLSAMFIAQTMHPNH